MLILMPARLIVLAVPKTGSSALHSALAPYAGVSMTGPPEVKHMRLARVQNRVLPLFPQAPDRFDSFALIRHPVDWLGSWFRYRQRPKLEGRPNSTAGMSFAGFIRAYLSDAPPPFARVGVQSWTLQPAKGARGVDHLFRYEAMEAALAFLSARTGAALDLPRENVSPPGDLDLPDGLRQQLTQRLSDDMALWQSARHQPPPPCA